MDQLDVVQVVRLVALVGERLLVILPEEQGVRACDNDVDTFRCVCSFETRDSHSFLIEESRVEESFWPIGSSY